MSVPSFILIVEDDETLGQGVEFALKKEGFRVQLAVNYAQAQSCLSGDLNGLPDLILADVGLPDGSGFDLCQAVKASPRSCHIPVIFLTAQDEEVNIVRGLDLGGDDYITKPFRLSELLARVRAVLRRNQARVSEKSVLECRGLILDDEGQFLYRDDHRVDLSATELRLIRCFFSHPEQVLSREQILDQIYGTVDSFSDENTLSVYIRRLRQKIESDPNSPEFIQTVRGMGYRWNGRVVQKPVDKS